MATVDTAVVYDEDPAAASPARKPAAAGGAAASAPAARDTIVVHLNSNERVYFDIRDANIETVSGRLNAKMREIMALTDSVRVGGIAKRLLPATRLIHCCCVADRQRQHRRDARR